MKGSTVARRTTRYPDREPPRSSVDRAADLFIAAFRRPWPVGARHTSALDQTSTGKRA
jgi:hypothetical protein